MRPVLQRSYAAQGARWGCGTALLLLVVGVGTARAHVVYGTRTIAQLVDESDVVARVRITRADGALAIEDPPLRRPSVTADVLEVLKGEPMGGPLTFVQHGHGVVEHANGEEVVLFLTRIERLPELAATAVAKHVRWVSVQESQDKISLAPPSGDALLAAIRAYATVATLPSAAARLDGLRRITLRLLGSREPSLAASAARDLVRAGDIPLVTAADLPTLSPLIDDPRVAIETRLALLAELERRGLVSGAPRWERLLRETRRSDLPVAVRAAGVHPSAGVTTELIRILEGDDTELAAAAAVALGTAGNERAVEALADALAREDSRIRMSAIRGLGRIGTPSARRALELAAAFHPDPATRRRASAEVIILARRHGTSGPL